MDCVPRSYLDGQIVRALKSNREGRVVMEFEQGYDCILSVQKAGFYPVIDYVENIGGQDESYSVKLPPFDRRFCFDSIFIGNAQLHDGSPHMKITVNEKSGKIDELVYTEALNAILDSVYYNPSSIQISRKNIRYKEIDSDELKMILRGKVPKLDRKSLDRKLGLSRKVQKFIAVDVVNEQFYVCKTQGSFSNRHGETGTSSLYFQMFSVTRNDSIAISCEPLSLHAYKEF